MKEKRVLLEVKTDNPNGFFDITRNKVFYNGDILERSEGKAEKLLKYSKEIRRVTKKQVQEEHKNNDEE